MEEQRTKICTRCKLENNLSSFSRRLDRKSGYASICKNCLRINANIKRNGEYREFIPRSNGTADKRYLWSNSKESQKSWGRLTELPKPKYCNYELCKCIIPDIRFCSKSKDKIYCNKWCMQMGKDIDINHRCITCGVALSPYIRKRDNDNDVKNKNSSVYPKFCDAHKLKRHKNLPPLNNEVEEVVDMDFFISQLKKLSTWVA